MPQGHSNSNRTWHSRALLQTLRGKGLGPVPSRRKNLFSQFLIFVFRAFPALKRHPDPQRSQSRPGVALCCPLASTACPAPSPLTAQDRARQTRQALQGSPLGCEQPPRPAACRSGVGNSCGGWLETARAGRGSLPGVWATSAQHTPQEARDGRVGSTAGQEPAPAWTLSLFSLAQGLVTRGAHKHSLSLGFRGCGPHGRLGHLERTAPGAEAVSTVTAAPPLLQH